MLVDLVVSLSSPASLSFSSCCDEDQRSLITCVAPKKLIHSYPFLSVNLNSCINSYNNPINEVNCHSMPPNFSFSSLKGDYISKRWINSHYWNGEVH